MRSNRRAGFTLLELVVVLAILAIVTALAVRSLDGVQDQKRYEATQRGLEEISAAVLGSPDDRAADGSRTIGGFVADMGRLPRTVGTADLTLAELWRPPANASFIYDVRSAVGIPTAGFTVMTVAAEDHDLQVRVPGGWRGPYVRLPIAAASEVEEAKLLDGWGNPVTSPAAPPTAETLEIARLLESAGVPVSAVDQEIRIVRHLGSNGKANAADLGYDRDEVLEFTDDKFQAGLSGTIEVLDGDSPADPGAFAGQAITIRVFGPKPGLPNQIAVVRTAEMAFNQNPIPWSIPASAGLTMGPRIVRAYLHPLGNLGTLASTKRSAVKSVTLRAGVNFLEMTIDR